MDLFQDICLIEVVEFLVAKGTILAKLLIYKLSIKVLTFCLICDTIIVIP